MEASKGDLRRRQRAERCDSGVGVAGGHSIGILARRPDVTLPPGQHLIDGFPRFGTHLARPAPAVPIVPVIEISGAVAKSVALPLAALAYPAAAPTASTRRPHGSRGPRVIDRARRRSTEAPMDTPLLWHIP